MLRISKMADYAAIIMNCLATHPQQLFSAAEIAKQVHVAVPTASKILKLLLEARLVTSTRGAGGGYKLLRNAREISVIEIIGAVDGAQAITECSKGEKVCLHDSVCALRDNWRIINRVIFAALQNLTLADMMNPLGFQKWANQGVAFKTAAANLEQRHE